MSEVSDAAVVRLFLADYAAVDAASKLNMIGGGLSLIGFNPGTSLSAPFSLVATVSVPPALYGAECSVEIILEDAAGVLVSLPGPTGETQTMRVGQAVTFQRPIFPAASVPENLVDARVQWVLNFAAGLPLPVGNRYIWRIRIDHETRPDWVEAFFVPGPPPGPVIG
ncbi:MAG: hypothetical protein ABJA34_14005 [Pseudonocardiales bacterium]